MKAVLDASPIIAFFDELASGETLLLVKSLGYDLVVPEAVCVEDIVKEPSKSALDRCLSEGSIVRLGPVKYARVEQFQLSHPGLGRGESEVLLAAVDILASEGSVLCVIDEGPARKMAARMGLPLTGTIGLVNRLAAAGLISPAERSLLLGRLQNSDFRAEARFFR